MFRITRTPVLSPQLRAILPRRTGGQALRDDFDVASPWRALAADRESESLRTLASCARQLEPTPGVVAIPTVLVVIPAYNPGLLLDRTLESLCRQTFTDWRCVVVDDGSPEDLSRIDDLDPRVTRVRQENHGLAATRNRGVALAADADLVAFLDQDDVWASTKLATQVEVHRGGAEFTSTGTQLIDSGGADIDGTWFGPVESLEQLLAANSICVSSVMVDRRAFVAAGGFNIALRQIEDWDLWIRLWLSGARSTHIAEDLTFYRRHDKNMSKQTTLMTKTTLAMLKFYEQTFGLDGRTELAAASRRGQRAMADVGARLLMDELGSQIRGRRPEAAFRTALTAFRFSPRIAFREVGQKMRHAIEPARQ